MSKAKVLLVDLETLPNIGYTWTKWDTNVIRFIKEWELASIAYKWLGEKHIHCVTRNERSERELVKKLRDLFDQADVIVAHNGDEFDIKKARAKFIQFGLNPPSPSRSVDTKKIAKSQFSFNSNSLNDLGETLGLGKKIDTGGFDLWVQCMAGDAEAWGRMAKYNKQDVALLEKVYLKFRAWAPNHPSLAVLEGRIGCKKCGSSHVHFRGKGLIKTKLGRKMQCQACGGWETIPISVAKKIEEKRGNDE